MSYPALQVRARHQRTAPNSYFSLGELIWVTDFASAAVAALWIGDGATPGGIAVSGQGGGGITNLPFDVISWTNASAVEYVSSKAAAPVVASIKPLTSLDAVWEFTGTVSLPNFTDGAEVVGKDITGRTVSGVYTAGTGGTNYATLNQVNYERTSNFVVGTLYNMTWYLGKLASAGIYLDNGVAASSFQASQIGAGSNVSITADILNPGRYTLNATGGSGSVSVNGTPVTNANLTDNTASLGTVYSVTGSVVKAALRNSDVAAVADTEIAAKIGSAPGNTYTNSGAFTVGNGFGNAGTTCTFISTSYATAKAFLQTPVIGCTPPAGGLGNWTLPSLASASLAIRLTQHRLSLQRSLKYKRALVLRFYRLSLPVMRLTLLVLQVRRAYFS